MVSLISNRSKRQAEFPSSSPSGFGYDTLHISKKLKSSSTFQTSVAPKKNSASRLSLYPPLVNQIDREIQAPCIVVKGFTATSKRFEGNFGENSRQKLNISGDGMGSFFSKAKELRSKYDTAKDAAFGTFRFVNVEQVEVTDVDDVRTVNEDNDASGDSSVEEIAVVESEKREIDKPGELQNIRAKLMELDRKDEENLEFQPSTSSGVVSELMDGKALESLSLNQRLDVSDLDVGLPYHKRLLNDSAKKRDPKLKILSFDIKLLEEKRASFKPLHPVKKDEDLLTEPFRELTEDEDEMVANALSISNRRKVLVTHENSNITITGEVLQCLGPRAWLNDEVINLYLELLKEREKKEPKKFLKCHFFNTFFYKKLISGRTGYDYKSVRRWTTQRKLGYSLLECDKIFVPVHKEIHWCLAVINKKEEKFQYLDSLGGVDKHVMRVLAKYIVDEVKDKNGLDIDVTSWEQEYVKDLPSQENGFDCGVFMIKYADFYSRDIGLCFKQKDMPYFRKRTAKEILNLRAY